MTERFSEAMELTAAEWVEEGVEEGWVAGVELEGVAVAAAGALS